MQRTKSLLFTIVLCLSLTTSQAVTFETLVSFSGTNGVYPVALIQTADGGFMGTTRYGGIDFPSGAGSGTVFKLTPDGVLSNLVMFANERANPGSLLRASDHHYYGSLLSGEGALFKLTSDGALTNFNPVTFGATNGLNPVLFVEDEVGNLFGVTSHHSPGTGSVFKMGTNGMLTTIAMFHGTNGSYPGPLILGPGGTLYGVTYQGGFNQNGTLYRLTPDGTVSALVLFQGTNGTSPAWLLRGHDGFLYGATAQGGTGYGSVFKVSTNGSFVWSYFFNGTNGSFPSFLMQGADGSFYGSTASGGLGFFDGFQFSGNGTLFKVTPAGEFTSLFAFDGTNGAEPFLILTGQDGHLYGTTMSGGAYGLGTVFRLSVPIAPVLQNPVRTNDSLTLTWNAVAGYSYQLQSNSNLSPTNWNNVGSPVIATNGTMSVSDAIGEGSLMFYRIALLP